MAHSGCWGNADRTTEEQGPDCYRLVGVDAPVSRFLTGRIEDDVDRALPGPPALIEERLERRKGHFMPLGLLKSQLDDMKALAPDEEGIVLSIG